MIIKFVVCEPGCLMIPAVHIYNIHLFFHVKNKLTLFMFRVLHTFEDVVWHVSWSVCGNILAVSGGDNKVRECFMWKIRAGCINMLAAAVIIR